MRRLPVNQHRYASPLSGQWNVVLEPAVCVMDDAKLASDSSGNEDFCDEYFVIERNEAVLRVSVCSTQLGARTKRALKSRKKSSQERAGTGLEELSPTESYDSIRDFAPQTSGGLPEKESMPGDPLSPTLSYVASEGSEYDRVRTRKIDEFLQKAKWIHKRNMFYALKRGMFFKKYPPKDRARYQGSLASKCLAPQVCQGDCSECLVRPVSNSWSVQASMGRESQRAHAIKGSRNQLEKGISPLSDEDDSNLSSSTSSDQDTTSGAVPADEVEGAVSADSSTLIRRLLSDHGLKASQNSYKKDGLKARQEDLFPKLEAEIKERKFEMFKGLKYPDRVGRRNTSMRRKRKSKIKSAAPPRNKRIFSRKSLLPTLIVSGWKGAKRRL